jgi:hypothetical protein
MRLLGDFRRLLVILGVGLALVTCGAAVSQAATSARATNAATTTGATATGATSLLPRNGNPAGHATVPSAARAVNTSHPNHVIRDCTSAAVVRAVAEGGVITFSCGPNPVTITMTATAKVVNTHRRTVIDGGGKVTLSGGGKIRILYMNTCDAKQHLTTSDCWQQKWPQLVVQNMNFTDAYSGVRETSTSNYGGGAIFAQGGQLKVVNSGFTSNRCYKSGPDLGGAAIRALGIYAHRPVYLTDDTFRGGRCANGGAVSGLFAGFAIYNSLFVNNKAIGFGANPQAAGTAGGGSGGAIYTDGGENYDVYLAGTAIRDCHATEGGGAIFFVIDKGSSGQSYHGNVYLEQRSVLHANPSGKFQNAPGIFDSVDGQVTAPAKSSNSIDN